MQDCKESISSSQSILIRQLEEMAANTWPAEVTQEMDGWILRAAGGYSLRANSVLALGPLPSHPQWLEEVEDFYFRRSLPVLFHVSPASDPRLEPLLEERGYGKLLSVSLHVAETRQILRMTEQAEKSAELTVHSAPLPDQEWMDVYMQYEEFPPERRAFSERLCAAKGPRAAYLLVRVKDRPAGLATVVTERGWTGLTNVVTGPDFRRMGVARALLCAAAEWSESMGAGKMYLQVEDKNKPALGLYAKAGFRKLYGYHYRTKGLCAAAACSTPNC
jgi:ribosomal protein S18 acetylase RimI-like enzyme